MGPPSGQKKRPIPSSPLAKKAKPDEHASSASNMAAPMATDVNNMNDNARRQLLLADDSPPQWFKTFDASLEQRFDIIIGKKLEPVNDLLNEHDEKIKALQIDAASVKKKVATMEKAYKAIEAKLDDLENRSRRNNLVIYGMPETEGREDCNKVLSDLLHFAAVDDEIPSIERCHRTPTQKSPENDKPRMIHVAFRSFRSKEKVRKACLAKLKNNQFKQAKLFVTDDLSKKIQEQRRNKMGQFKELKANGKKPFFIYPDKLCYRDLAGKLIAV